MIEPPLAAQRILFALTYYRPHVSGVTLYVQRLAEGLARRGHTVTILTSRYADALPLCEEAKGVSIVRVPVVLHVSKGVVMPQFPAYAWRLIGQHDVVNVQLPQFEGGLLALYGRLRGKPVVLTHHCDLRLPPGWFNRLVDQAAWAMNVVAAQCCARIVIHTHDYADHSPLLSRFRRKVRAIYPPVVVSPVDAARVEAFRDEQRLRGRTVVGVAARIAAEKGIEHVLCAIPEVCQAFPGLTVLFAGEWERVMGEDAYLRRLRPLIEQHRDRVAFLGVLPPEQMSTFYASCDALVVSSINSTEAFGLVQVEAMLCGTPVVATDLPGVREPVRITGMGEVVPPGCPRALAQGIVRVLRDPRRYRGRSAEVARAFCLTRTLESYERLFREVGA